MAILQALASDKALRINDYNLIGLVQDLDWQMNFNAQDVNELGNTARLATEKELEVTGSFTVNASGALPGILARMAVKRNAGTDAYEGSVYASGGAGGKNAYTFTETDLGEMIFDLIEHERPDSTTFSRSLAFPRMFLTGLTCRVDANGRGTSQINFAGDFIFGAQNPFHDLRSIHATRTTATTATMADTSMTGYTCIYVMVNEKLFDTDNTKATYVTMSNAGVVTFTTSEGFTIDAKDIIRVWVYKTTPGTAFPQLTTGERSTTAYFMKGYMVSAYLAPANVASVLSTEQWLRAQTLEWNVDLRVEVLRQIAYNSRGTSVYARVPTTPFNINMTATITETDWADWKSLLTHTFDGVDVYDNLYEWTPAVVKDPFAVVVKYYTLDMTPLTEWRFTDMRIDNPGTRQAVGGRGETSWTLVGNAFTLIGYNG